MDQGASKWSKLLRVIARFPDPMKILLIQDVAAIRLEIRESENRAMARDRFGRLGLAPFSECPLNDRTAYFIPLTPYSLRLQSVSHLAAFLV